MRRARDRMRECAWAVDEHVVVLTAQHERVDIGGGHGGVQLLDALSPHPREIERAHGAGHGVKATQPGARAASTTAGRLPRPWLVRKVPIPLGAGGAPKSAGRPRRPGSDRLSCRTRRLHRSRVGRRRRRRSPGARPRPSRRRHARGRCRVGSRRASRSSRPGTSRTAPGHGNFAAVRTDAFDVGRSAAGRPWASRAQRRPASRPTTPRARSRRPGSRGRARRGGRRRSGAARLAHLGGGAGDHVGERLRVEPGRDKSVSCASRNTRQARFERLDLGIGREPLLADDGLHPADARLVVAGRGEEGAELAGVLLLERAAPAQVPGPAGRRRRAGHRPPAEVVPVGGEQQGLPDPGGAFRPIRSRPRRARSPWGR